jgi:hypothetical protein
MRQGSTAPSGARVFAAGSLHFATGLDEWPAHGTGVENSGLRHFAVNLVTDLGGIAPATIEQLFATPKPMPPVLVKPAPCRGKSRCCACRRGGSGQSRERPAPTLGC